MLVLVLVVLVVVVVVVVACSGTGSGSCSCVCACVFLLLLLLQLLLLVVMHLLFVLVGCIVGRFCLDTPVVCEFSKLEVLTSRVFLKVFAHGSNMVL